jgi:hypothetical protein
VTMGGNDLLAAYGDASAARRAIGTVADNGRRLLAGLRDLVGPEAPIVIATVYDPSDGSGDAARLGLPPGRRRWSCWLGSTGRCGRWPKTTGRWWPMCMPGSSAMAWPPGIPPSWPRARPIVACGIAA